VLPVDVAVKDADCPRTTALGPAMTNGAAGLVAAACPKEAEQTTRHKAVQTNFDAAALLRMIGRSPPFGLT